MVTIKRAAELTGVTAHTIRAWERRYGIVVPSRTASGYRLYSDEELRRLRTMKELVDRGWTASVAAESSRHGGDAKVAVIDELVDAAARLDGEAALQILLQQFASDGFEEVVDGFLMPALVELGRAWEDGRVSVAGEHLVANLVKGRLAAAYQEVPAGSGPVLVIGTPPGSEHELGLYAFATAARRAGATTVYLGADVPAADWRLAASLSGATAAVTAVHVRRDVAKLAPLADQLSGLGLSLWVGGGYQDRAPAAWRPLGAEIAPAARRLASVPVGG